VRLGDTESGFCRRHRRLVGEWNDGVEEARYTCCFKECGNIIDPEAFGWELPICRAHVRCVQWMKELEEWGYAECGLKLPQDEEWLGAKWIAAILGGKKGKRWCLDRIRGDTPLTRIMCTVLGDLYLVIPPMTNA
jgi:hypothetical protein